MIIERVQIKAKGKMMGNMIYLHRFEDIKATILTVIPEDATIRKLDSQDAICIVQDQNRRDEIIMDLKQSVDAEFRSDIHPIRCVFESPSLIELLLHDGSRVSFAKLDHY